MYTFRPIDVSLYRDEIRKECILTFLLICQNLCSCVSEGFLSIFCKSKQCFQNTKTIYTYVKEIMYFIVHLLKGNEEISSFAHFSPVILTSNRFSYTIKFIPIFSFNKLYSRKQ